MKTFFILNVARPLHRIESGSLRTKQSQRITMNGVSWVAIIGNNPQTLHSTPVPRCKERNRLGLKDGVIRLLLLHILGVTKRYSATCVSEYNFWQVVSFRRLLLLTTIAYLSSLLFGQSQQAGLLQYSRFPSRRTTKVVHAYSLNQK